MATKKEKSEVEQLQETIRQLKKNQILLEDMLIKKDSEILNLRSQLLQIKAQEFPELFQPQKKVPVEESEK